MDAMKELHSDGTLKSVEMEGDVIDVRVAPPAEVGSFSEEERSKQVCLFHNYPLMMMTCNTVS